MKEEGLPSYAELSYLSCRSSSSKVGHRPHSLLLSLELSLHTHTHIHTHTIDEVSMPHYSNALFTLISMSTTGVMRAVSMTAWI